MEIQAIFTKIDRRDDMTIADLQQYTDWALSTRKHGRGNGEVMHTLRDYRRRAVDASDSMVAAAEREARGLLASEQRAVDKHCERVTAIDQLIDRLEREDRENPPYSVTGAPVGVSDSTWIATVTCSCGAPIAWPTTWRSRKDTSSTIAPASANSCARS
jgi:GTP1/Obg family GTP-binding protein